ARCSTPRRGRSCAPCHATSGTVAIRRPWSPPGHPTAPVPCGPSAAAATPSTHGRPPNSSRPSARRPPATSLTATWCGRRWPGGEACCCACARARWVASTARRAPHVGARRLACVSYRLDNNGPVRPPDQFPPPPPAWYPPPPIPQPKGGSARTGPLPLHPMTLGDILDGAFKLLKANLRTIAIVAGVFIVPGQLLVAFAQRGSGVSDAV